MTNDLDGASAPETQPTEAAKAARNKKSRLLLRATTKEIPTTEHYCAIAVVTALRELGGFDAPKNEYGAVGRDALLAGLKDKQLKTKQLPTRILYYWKKHLITGGYIEKASWPTEPTTQTVAAPAEPPTAAAEATSTADIVQSPAST